MRRLVAAAACLVSLSLAGPSRADVVVPGGLSGVEGNSNNAFPFNPALFSVAQARYQQVYAAAEFGLGPITITGMAFRPDSADNGQAFSTVLGNVSISLSTTAAAVDGLSTTYAANIGADSTLVHSGALALSSANTGPTNGPKDFDIVITFTNPFTYNPANGNLLLDVTNFLGGSTTQFDAAFTPGDGVSRVVSGNVNDVSGGADTLGLVTMFLTGTPIPEPATIALFGPMLAGWGLLGLAAARRRRHAAH